MSHATEPISPKIPENSSLAPNKSPLSQAVDRKKISPELKERICNCLTKIPQIIEEKETKGLHELLSRPILYSVQRGTSSLVSEPLNRVNSNIAAPEIWLKENHHIEKKLGGGSGSSNFLITTPEGQCFVVKYYDNNIKQSYGHGPQLQHQEGIAAVSESSQLQALGFDQTALSAWLERHRVDITCVGVVLSCQSIPTAELAKNLHQKTSPDEEYSRINELEQALKRGDADASYVEMNYVNGMDFSRVIDEANDTDIPSLAQKFLGFLEDILDSAKTMSSSSELSLSNVTEADGIARLRSEWLEKMNMRWSDINNVRELQELEFSDIIDLKGFNTLAEMQTYPKYQCKGEWVPNPHTFVSKLIKGYQDYFYEKIAFWECHGDLNLENVLYDSTKSKIISIDGRYTKKIVGGLKELIKAITFGIMFIGGKSLSEKGPDFGVDQTGVHFGATNIGSQLIDTENMSKYRLFYDEIMTELSKEGTWLSNYVNDIADYPELIMRVCAIIQAEADAACVLSQLNAAIKNNETTTINKLKKRIVGSKIYAIQLLKEFIDWTKNPDVTIPSKIKDYINETMDTLNDASQLFDENYIQ